MLQAPQPQQAPKRQVPLGDIEPLTDAEMDALIAQKIELAQKGELDAELDPAFANLLRAEPTK